MKKRYPRTGAGEHEDRGRASPTRCVAWLAAAACLVLPALADAQVVSGLLGGSGSTVGPDGALYVTEGLAGRVTRIDPATGSRTIYAEGLPASVIGIGGAMDVAFLDGTAYVLVTLVGPPFGANVDGIYRVDGPNEFTAVADIGTFASQNPPSTSFALPNGVQYAIETYRGGFLVTDGHHNRVLHASTDGEVSVAWSFGNVVPTGLDVWGDSVLMARAGAVPHLAADGRILEIYARSGAVRERARGAPLIVDVERGRGGTLFALAQGHWSPGQPDGTPADPGTGSLLRVRSDGTMEPLVTGIDRPTSMEIIDNTAYVVTMGGDVWKYEGLEAPPFGSRR